MWCLLSTHHLCCGVRFGGVCVVMAVCDDSVCLVLSHCVVGCGMAVGGCESVWSRCLFFSSCLSLLFVLVFGVVRAQLCEHARYPRTPLCSLVVFSLLFSPPFFVPRLSCYCGMAVCVFTMCRCV